MTPSLPFLLEAADLDLSQSPLQSGSSYNISVNPVDMFGTVNSGSTHTTHVLPDAPTVQGDDRRNDTINIIRVVVVIITISIVRVVVVIITISIVIIVITIIIVIIIIIAIAIV